MRDVRTRPQRDVDLDRAPSFIIRVTDLLECISHCRGRLFRAPEPVPPFQDRSAGLACKMQIGACRKSAGGSNKVQCRLARQREHVYANKETPAERPVGVDGSCPEGAQGRWGATQRASARRGQHAHQLACGALVQRAELLIEARSKSRSYKCSHVGGDGRQPWRGRARRGARNGEQPRPPRAPGRRRVPS